MPSKSYASWSAGLLAGLFAALASFSVRAAVLLQDNFDYPNGPLIVVSAGIWQTHSGVTGQVDVAVGRVTLTGTETEDVDATLLGAPYPTSTNINLYASFLVRFSALPSGAGEYFAHFKDATGNFRARLFALTSGASAGQFRLGLASTSNVPVVICTNDLALNTDYRAYLKYGVSNAVATLWINPDAESAPSVTDATTPAARTVTGFALRQSTGIGDLSLDELRVGTTFAEVYAPAPVMAPLITLQPVGAIAVSGAAAGFWVVASGTPPLHYQWARNETPIPDATDATLMVTNVTAALAGQYRVVITNSAGSVTSAVAILTVVEPNAAGVLTFVTYNLKGNFAADWSTNAPQVQAIARELHYLDPDIIALNEIPNDLRYEMTNWMTAFFPTYVLAVSPTTDGAIRNGVMSRFPIARSQSWLAHAGLTNFGYAGTFTRDLFEAEITVPGATEPLHVFSAHLKSGSDADSQDRRAAECSAVSNFLVTVFGPAYGSEPYLLAGDLNEDLALPMSHNDQPIQRLLGSDTGLQLTTPLNPFTRGRFTHSIQGGLDARYDYILPAGTLALNILGSQVFRTDVPPLPPAPLLANDDVTASDHLPVVMVFHYPDPGLRVTLSLTNKHAVLEWPALVGRRFRLDASTNLTQWETIASNITATATRAVWSETIGIGLGYFRVVRVP